MCARFIELTLKRLMRFTWRRVAVLVAIMVIAVAGLIMGERQPLGIKSSLLCSFCHEMQAEFQTWQASAHNNVACIACHQERGFADLLPAGLQSDPLGYLAPVQTRGAAASFQELVRRLQIISGEIYAHLKSESTAPVVIRRMISDSACLQCHSVSREITPSGDLLIPHQVHADRKVRCVNCHRGVVHAQIGRRKLQAAGDTAEGLGDEAAWAKTMDPAYLRPSMVDCTKCHQRRKVTNECKACHTRQRMPETHLTTDFQRSHGSEARQQQVKYCNDCHKYDFPADVPAAVLADPVLYSRENPFCSDCHGKMPPTHLRSDWRTSHGEDIKVASCTTCHATAAGQQGTAARTNCIQCHDQSQAHAREWRVRHPLEVGKSPEKSCFNCHSQATCTRCHSGFGTQ